MINSFSIFKVSKSSITLILWFLISFFNAYAQELSLVDTGWSANSVNAVIFRKNSLVSNKNDQYIAFYNRNGLLTLGKRQIGSNNWEIKTTSYKGNVSDAHNSISIMVDGDGYLHIALDHHNNPLHYFKSIEPGSLELSNESGMTGTLEDVVSYPEFYRFPDGDLLFLYRAGGSGNGNLVMNYYSCKSKTWQRIHNVLIDGEEKRNAYWQAFVDASGSIHLSWVWRETPDVASNHDMCYAVSNDRGKTWKKSTGENYNLPITERTAEIAWPIPQNSELINQTSISADSKAQPYIVTYFRTGESNIPQYQLIFLKKGVWNSIQISDRKTPFSLSGMGTKKIPISRPQILIKEKDNTLKAILIYRDIERGNVVSATICNNFPNGKWKTSDLTDFSVQDWEPSFDTELWNEKQKLNLYVQCVGQGDGEQKTNTKPQPVYVLEVDF
jgi:hypothetical protein